MNPTKDIIIILLTLLTMMLAFSKTEKRTTEYELEVFTYHDIFYIDGLKVTSETGFDYHFRNMQELNDFISSETLRAVKDCLDDIYYFEYEEEELIINSL